MDAKLERVKKLFMMLSSDNDGEILNSVSAIKKIYPIKDLCLHLFEGQKQQKKSNDFYQHPLREKAELMMDNQEYFSEREFDFIQSIWEKRILRRIPLSEKQAKWFEDLYLRVNNGA